MDDQQKNSESDGRKPELPGQTGEVFLAVENEVIRSHAEWGIQQQLFEKDDDWDLLVRSSAFAWPILHDALVERCILRIARLTDRAATGSSKGNQNLSFERLVRVLATEGHDDLQRKLQADLVELRQFVEPLTSLRHKVLAHSDVDTLLGKRNYPQVSINRVNQILPRIAAMCNTARANFKLPHFHYDWCFGAWAGGILDDLRRLQRFDAIWDCVRKMEDLNVYELRRAILQVRRGASLKDASSLRLSAFA